MSAAVTPGQAAYEAYWRCAADEFGPDVDDAAPSIERWDTLSKWQQRAWEAAAREPHPAPVSASQARRHEAQAAPELAALRAENGRLRGRLLGIMRGNDAEIDAARMQADHWITEEGL